MTQPDKEPSLARQIAEIQRRERLADKAETAAAWAALAETHPEPEVWSAYVRWLKKNRLHDELAAAIDSWLPADVVDPALLLHRAELLDDAGLLYQSEALFERLITAPRSTKIRINFAKRLRKRGLIIRALDVILPIAATLSAKSRSYAIFAEIRDACELLARLEPERLTPDADARILAMHQAILMFRNRVPRTREPGRLGRLALITGSMGPGGAERQIVRIATGLEQARSAQRSVGGVVIDEPVEVVVKSLSSTPRAGFFAPELTATGIAVREIDDMPVTSPKLDAVADRDLMQLLKILPPQSNYGVGRLTGYLRDRHVDIAGLWQDGACFFGALGALLAEVPTIQLSFRGLPPSVRAHMFRPEYEDLYRALAQVPGVQLHCNSKVTAQEYAAWLDIPVERFTVIYNGVLEHSTAGTAASHATWQAFAERTPGATRTIGGVFRFDTDKRPLVWIRLAAKYLKRWPDARFVLVGDGRLLAQAQALGVELGIADRTLYVGNSADVGFWMAKLDVMVLTSRFEGLPNVLIEAQMIGTPVVSTPAGGAAECFIEGVTGSILECADKPDLDAACDKIEALVLTGSERAKVGDIARRNAVERFSVDHMLAHFAAASCALPAPVPRPVEAYDLEVAR